MSSEQSKIVNVLDDQISKYLINNDVMKSDRFKVIHMLAANARDINSFNILKGLCDDDNSLVNSETDNGYTPLMVAVKHSTTTSSLECVEYLISKGSDLNHRSKKRRTVLMTACEPVSKSYNKSSYTFDNYDCIKLLLENGADPNIEKYKRSGYTSFVECVLKFGSNEKDFRSLELLIKHGANINVILEKYSSLSLLAILCKRSKRFPHNNFNLELITFLLENGADPNLIGKDDYEFTTPLHIACSKKDKNLINLLFKYDCHKSLMIEDHIGNKPIDYCDDDDLKNILLREEVKLKLRYDLKENVIHDLQNELRGELENDVRLELKNEIRNKFEYELKNEIKNEMRDKFRHDHEDEIKNELKYELKDSVIRDLEDEFVDDVRDKLEIELEDEVRKDLRYFLMKDVKKELRDELRNNSEFMYKIEFGIKYELKCELKSKLKEELKNEFISKIKLGSKNDFEKIIDDMINILTND